MGSLQTARTSGAALAIAIAICIVSAITAPAASARRVRVSERASLHLVKKSGSTIYQTGTTTGTLSGAVQTRFVVSLTTVTGVMTVFPRGGGSLTFDVTGSATSAGVRARFNARLKVIGGTGRYRRASGSGTGSGVVNRRNWSATVAAGGHIKY